jgi:hypothetical protein
MLPELVRISTFFHAFVLSIAQLLVFHITYWKNSSFVTRVH